MPGVNWFLLAACIGLVLGVPVVDQPRRRLRRRGDAHDGHHHHADRRGRLHRGTGRRPKIVAVSSRWPHRSGVRRCEPVQDPAGGWVPLAIGLVGFSIFTTWRTGRRSLTAASNGAALGRTTSLRTWPRTSPAAPGHRRLPAPSSGPRATGAAGQPAPQRQPARDRRVRFGDHRRATSRATGATRPHRHTTISASTNSTCTTGSPTGRRSQRTCRT